MNAEAVPPRLGRDTAERTLRRAVWLGLAVLIGTEAAVDLWPVQGTHPWVQIVRSVLMVLVLLRVLWAAWVRPAKRGALVALAIGQTMWAVGSMVIASTTDPAAIARHVSPGEVFFLGAFVGFAVFIVLDAHGRSLRSLAVWLEAAVLAGAGACVAVVAVLVPAAANINSAGLPLLLALLYPLSDVVLVLALLAQVGLRQRNPNRRSALLILGFALLAVVDAAFASRLAEGRYDFTLAMNVAWAVSAVLVAQAACLPSSPVASTPRRRFGSAALLVSAAIAVVVLVLSYPPQLELPATLVALATLVAVGGRAIIAFRDAQQTAAAYRSSLRDELTGLANRRGVMAAIEGLPADSTPALLVLGIDSFRDVNESLGHTVGDNVLQLFGVRLLGAVPAQVPIGRLEADVFAVVLRHADHGQVDRTALEIRQALGAPFRVADVEVALSVAVGVAEGTPGESATELLRRSSVAMYRAKACEVGIAIYDAVEDELSRQHLKNAETLRNALSSDQIEVWYQPQVAATTRQVVGVEALVRWNHPGEGLRTPDSFLPTARRAGLMPALTEVVLRRVVADAQRWQELGNGWRTAVNIAPPELLGGFVIPQLRSLVRGSGLLAGSLGVEVTEDSFLNDPVRARDLLQALHAEGIEISVDDFGTGFSSLAYLRDLHAQELKIDRSFVGSMTDDDKCHMIVEATTRMAHGLGLRVVAEGVETEATAAALVAMGVDVLQGYLIARPMPAQALDVWLADGQRV